jgi:hypothetical protein
MMKLNSMKAPVFFFETNAPVFCCHDGIVFSGGSLDVQLCYGGFSFKKIRTYDTIADVGSH